MPSTLSILIVVRGCTDARHLVLFETVMHLLLFDLLELHAWAANGRAVAETGSSPFRNRCLALAADNILHFFRGLVIGVLHARRRQSIVHRVQFMPTAISCHNLSVLLFLPGFRCGSFAVNVRFSRFYQLFDFHAANLFALYTRICNERKIELIKNYFRQFSIMCDFIKDKETRIFIYR